MPVSEEARLVERLQGGDASALEALMSEYATRVYRLAFGITRDQGDAEEVVQDVFLTVATKCVTSPVASRMGEMVTESQNGSPSFLRFWISPCHTRPSAMVRHISR